MSSLTYTLPSGTKIPVPSYGVGTAWYKAKPGDLNRELIDSIKTAISVGYTHFDNAEVYNNEEEMGEAVAESKTPREKLYITTKVLPGIADIPGALKTSLKKLQTDYVDLYLIHSHNFAGKEGKPSLKEAWKKMEDLKDQGLVREIGVSNYSVESLKEIMKDAKHPPVANQIEIHPHNYADAKIIIDFCNSHEIRPESYGPLVPLRQTIGSSLEKELDAIAKEIKVTGISGEDGKGSATPGQVMLRWNYQIGSLPITTSSKEWRMKEMLHIDQFELTSDQVERINKAGEEKHYRAFGGMIGQFEGSLPEKK